jgi:hypothetical protein
MRDYFAYYWAVLCDLFHPERIPLEDLIEETHISTTEETR